ncbi:MAG: nucleotidyltransferase family protein [Prevotella sp.]|nr:nucleotidyltransferase family protein [Prevotella sp.]
MRQAMIFAAGLGTRLRPLTDHMPKAMVRVGERPLLWHVVMKLKEAGFERMVVNVHHFAEQIEDYLRQNDNFGLDICLSDESDMLLETGGGVRKAIPLFDADSPVLIHNVDILSNIDLAGFYKAGEESRAEACLLVSRRNTKRYLLMDANHRMKGWTNIQTGEVKPSREILENGLVKYFAFSGIHLLKPSLFPLLESWPQRFPIMDFYIQNCGQHYFEGKEKTDLQLIDVGKLDTLEEAEKWMSIHRLTTSK